MYLMAESPTRQQILTARIVIVLLFALALAGVLVHGFIPDVERAWRNIAARPGGPMTFRFVLQPTMAAIAAGRDGIKDARTGRWPYLWILVHDPAQRMSRLNEGLISTVRIILLGLVMDTVYQVAILKTFYPGEAAVVALVLAFLPYLILRGPINRAARRLFALRSTAVAKGKTGP
jgi:hypothetical protein